MILRLFILLAAYDTGTSSSSLARLLQMGVFQGANKAVMSSLSINYYPPVKDIHVDLTKAA